jgi:putative acetyltransferase
MIRDATERDYPVIRAILRHAFGTADEANLVEQLRADADVLLELVATDGEAVHGCILYSALAVERGEASFACAALAPVAVLPAFQRRGVGAALLEAGNVRCIALGLDAIIVLGHADYYPRFGFTALAAATLDAPFSGPSFMALELRPGVLSKGGGVRYARAFGV